MLFAIAAAFKLFQHLYQWWAKQHCPPYLARLVLIVQVEFETVNVAV